MKKFGTVLNSRPAGREAYLRVVQIINGAQPKEDIVLDFSGVEVLTPSFADEFLKLLKKHYGDRKIVKENTNAATVRETLEALKTT